MAIPHGEAWLGVALGAAWVFMVVRQAVQEHRERRRLRETLAHTEGLLRAALKQRGDMVRQLGEVQRERDAIITQRRHQRRSRKTLRRTIGGWSGSVAS